MEPYFHASSREENHHSIAPLQLSQLQRLSAIVAMPESKGIRVSVITEQSLGPCAEYGVEKSASGSSIMCFIESKEDMKFHINLTPTSKLSQAYYQGPGKNEYTPHLSRRWQVGPDAYSSNSSSKEVGTIFGNVQVSCQMSLELANMCLRDNELWAAIMCTTDDLTIKFRQIRCTADTSPAAQIEGNEGQGDHLVLHLTGTSLPLYI